MPDKDVRTIRDLIYYQYAKIITKKASGLSDGMQAKKQHYGLIKQKFQQLKSGLISWSEITREDWQLVESEKKCIYCGTEGDIHKEHIVPRSLQIKSECGTCDKIQSIHNQIWACRHCNSSKGTKGLYEFFMLMHPNEKKFYDIIPPLLEKKYLKIIYNCHECAGTLDKGDIKSVLDIDFILNKTPHNSG